jgi:hypothetical protein
MWELFELSYAFGRFNIPFPAQENVLGIGIYITGNAVRVLHAARLLAFFILTIGVLL